MPATISDYLQRVHGGSALVEINVGTWVQLVNNITSTAYVSTSATDANGKFTVANIPAGTYTVNTGPTNTGPWTATGDTSYVVAPSPAVFDVTDYGAKHDGVTDDAPAIAAAITACSTAGGGTVFMPPAGASNPYLVKSRNILPTNVKLRAGGRNSCWVKLDATFPTNTEAFRLGTVGGSIVVDTCISDMHLDCNNVTGSKGVYSELVNENCRIERMAIVSFMSRGIQIAQPSSGAGPQHYSIDEIELQTSASTPVGAIGIDIANTSVSTPIRHIRRVSIGGTTALTTAIKVDGINGHLEQIHIENMATGILVGSVLGCFGLTISDVDGLSNVTTSLITIANVGGQRSIMLYDINPAGGTTALTDNRSGVTITRDIGCHVIGPSTFLSVDSGVTSQLGGLKLVGPLSPSTSAGATQSGSLYQGSGAPSNSNGNNGDVYFRTDTPGTVNQRMYVKSAGTWTGVV